MFLFRITEITLQCKSSSVIDYLQAAGEQDISNDTIKYVSPHDFKF